MKLILTLSLALVAIISGFFACTWYSWDRMSRGYEVKLETHSAYLQTKLSEDLGYRGFDPAWLQKAWVNGFREKIGCRRRCQNAA